MAKESNLPAGVQLENLKPDLKPILGFICKPSDANPRAMRFCGIVLGAIGVENRWYAVQAMGKQHCVYTTQDDRANELAVKDGDVLGLSHTGALSGLEKKVGHYIVVTYTGKKRELKGGRAMWECDVQVSKRPVQVPSSGSDAEAPF